MTTCALSVEGLTKRYGHRTVVESLDLELPTGVVAGFVGPNGAGKTTTMAMLLGLVRPSGGHGEVLGRPLDRPARYLPEVGALIESPAFHPALTGAENLRLLATAGGHDPGRATALLELVGLEERGDDRYRTYSLGMEQRLGIAAALLGEPRLLILDEPSNGLDPQGTREMRALIADLGAGGLTILVSSHVLSELEQVCTWLVLIDAGRSVYQGPAAEFLDTSTLVLAPERAEDLEALRALAERCGHAARSDGGRVLIRTEEAARAAAELNRAAFAAGIVLVEVAQARSSLEERYLSVLEAGR